MAEPLRILGSYGETRNEEHKAVVRAALNDIVQRLSDIPGPMMADALASVMFTVFMNQVDPIDAYSTVCGTVAAAMASHMDMQPVGHA